MKIIKIMTGLIVIILLMRTITFAQPPSIPFKLGGTVSVNGVLITQSTQSGYTFEVTRQDGSSYDPVAEDNDGLNSSNMYDINVPLYDSLNQTNDAMPGETATMHAFYDNEELIITTPPDGEFQVGNSGQTLMLNIVASNNNAPSSPQLIYPADGQECSRTTEQFIWTKSTDPNGDQVNYKLLVCEDSEFTTGCLLEENIAYLNNKNNFHADINSWIFLFGIVISGAYCKKRKLALLITMIVIATMLLVSCGSTVEECEHPSVPGVDTQNEIVREISGMKSGTTYYWKVVVTDENDIEVHSETRSFTTQ